MGFRWLAIGQGGKLVSHNGQVWPPNEELEAACLFEHHVAPTLACSCGIYSYKDSDLAWGYQPTLNARFKTPAFRVFAAIECWGTIIEHDLGWRSQYATIRAICTTGRVHEVYEVDRYRDIELLIARYDIADD